MQQLVLNAQNLMQSVKDTVRAAEAASIKVVSIVCILANA